MTQSVTIDENQVTVPDSTPQAPEASKGPIFTAEDIERVRQEEKSKLYNRLAQAEERLSAMSKQLEEVLAERERERQEKERQIREAQEAAEKAKKQAEEEQMSLRQLLERRTAEWQEQCERIQREREEERALLEKEKQLAELERYKQQRINEERDNIAPELLDFITGNTAEEIEESIARLKEKTQAITNSLLSAQAAMAQNMRGVSPTGYGVDPTLNNPTGTKTYTAEDIKAMSLKEYAEKIRPHVFGNRRVNCGMFQ